MGQLFPHSGFLVEPVPGRQFIRIHYPERNTAPVCPPYTITGCLPHPGEQHVVILVEINDYGVGTDMIQLRLAECTLTGTAVPPELAEYGPGGPLPLTIAVVRGIGKRRRPDSVIAETYGIRGDMGSDGRGQLFQKKPTFFFRDRNIRDTGKIAVRKAGHTGTNEDGAGKRPRAAFGNQRNHLLAEFPAKSEPERCLEQTATPEH